MELHLALMVTLLTIFNAVSARSPPEKSHTSNGKVCNMKVITDHLFYKFAAGSNSTRAEELVKLYLENTNEIFKRGDFDNDGNQDNIGIKLELLQIVTRGDHPEYACLGQDYKNSSAFLDAINSNLRSPNHCLTLVLTFRPFGIILGKGFLAGMCSDWNSAFVTVANVHGQLLHENYATAMIAHELAHGFGADDEHAEANSTYCTPDLKVSSLMTYTKTFDEKGVIDLRLLNFSDCSKKRILDVLVAKPKCLISRKTSPTVEVKN